MKASNSPSLQDEIAERVSKWFGEPVIAVEEEILELFKRIIQQSKPEKKIPYWRSHKGDEIDHARAVGHDKALDLYEANLNRVIKGNKS